MELELLQQVDGLGGGARSVLLFWFYRQDRKHSEQRLIEIVRNQNGEREQLLEASQANAQAITELNILIRDRRQWRRGDKRQVTGLIIQRTVFNPRPRYQNHQETRIFPHLKGRIYHLTVSGWWAVARPVPYRHSLMPLYWQPVS